jgi:hypothetical protein
LRRDPYTAYDRRVPEPEAQEAAREYCTYAASVISGCLCDEPTTIRNVCRIAKTEVDRTFCDDKQIMAAQDGVWNATNPWRRWDPERALR